jgi:hypothetical protein
MLENASSKVYRSSKFSGSNIRDCGTGGLGGFSPPIIFHTYAYVIFIK